MVEQFKDKYPEADNALFIAWNAQVSGEVRLGKEVSIWYSATARGDIAPITIGDGSNIQDNAVCHVTRDLPLTVGADVTVGHNAILHSCRIGDNCLIGMGAIVLDHADIGRDSIVGAGSLVTKGKEFAPRSLIMGSPAKRIRELTDEEVAEIRDSARRYRENAAATAAAATAAAERRKG